VSQAHLVVGARDARHLAHTRVGEPAVEECSVDARELPQGATDAHALAGPPDADPEETARSMVDVGVAAHHVEAACVDSVG